MTDAQRVEMLVDFLSLAMQEDCQGTALSTKMEKVERWYAAHNWLSNPPAGTEPGVIQEEIDGMLAVEAEWEEHGELLDR